MLADHTRAGYLSMSWKTHLWSNLWLYCGLDARVSWEKPACGVIKVNNRRSLRVLSAPVWGQTIGPHIILQSSHLSSLLLASRPSPNTLLADKPDFVFAKGRRRDFCSYRFQAIRFWQWMCYTEKYLRQGLLTWFFGAGNTVRASSKTLKQWWANQRKLNVKPNVKVNVPLSKSSCAL